MAQANGLPPERGKSPPPGIVPPAKNYLDVSAQTVTPSRLGGSVDSKAVNMTLGKFALGLAVVFFSTAFGLEAFEDKKPEVVFDDFLVRFYNLYA